MKLKYIIALLIGTVLTSCGGGNSPEEVVKDFFAAVEAKDFDKAKSLATSESVGMISMMEKAVDFAGEGAKEESKAVTKVECEIEGDKGNCKCWGEAEGEEQNVAVKKVDGSWKVHMSKQDMMQDAMKGMGDMDMDAAQDKLKDIDMEKAMETFSEEIDSLGKALKEIKTEN